MGIFSFSKIITLSCGIFLASQGGLSFAQSSPQAAQDKIVQSLPGHSDASLTLRQLSEDGSKILFEASNISSSLTDLYLFDRTAGKETLIAPSLPQNSDMHGGSMSADGGKFVFLSTDCSNGECDFNQFQSFLYTKSTHTLEKISSPDPSLSSHGIALSPDGKFLIASFGQPLITDGALPDRTADTLLIKNLSTGAIKTIPLLDPKNNQALYTTGYNYDYSRREIIPLSDNRKVVLFTTSISYDFAHPEDGDPKLILNLESLTLTRFEQNKDLNLLESQPIFENPQSSIQLDYQSKTLNEPIEESPLVNIQSKGRYNSDFIIKGGVAIGNNSINASQSLIAFQWNRPRKSSRLAGFFEQERQRRVAVFDLQNHAVRLLPSRSSNFNEVDYGLPQVSANGSTIAVAFTDGNGKRSIAYAPIANLPKENCSSINSEGAFCGVLNRRPIQNTKLERAEVIRVYHHRDATPYVLLPFFRGVRYQLETQYLKDIDNSGSPEAQRCMETTTNLNVKTVTTHSVVKNFVSTLPVPAYACSMYNEAFTNLGNDLYRVRYRVLNLKNHRYSKWSQWTEYLGDWYFNPV